MAQIISLLYQMAQSRSINILCLYHETAVEVKMNSSIIKMQENHART